MRHVYALACRKGFSPPGVALPDLPPWVLETPHEPGRVCALGVGGPTWDPRDQRPSTLRDGKRALAAALESRLHQIVIDTGRSSV